MKEEEFMDLNEMITTLDSSINYLRYVNAQFKYQDTRKRIMAKQK